MGTEDSRVCFDGHAPTPFTADEIRLASPEGHTTKVLVETHNAAPVMRTTTFVGSDPISATMQIIEGSADEPASRRISTATSPWEDLQAHASYPQDQVTIADETIGLPWDRLDCLRYTVTDGDTTTIHWFARSYPGMPVRTNVWNGSDLIYTATVLSIEDT